MPETRTRAAVHLFFKETLLGLVLLPSIRVRTRWRTRLAPELRERLLQELDHCAWALSEMEVLLLDAHRSTGLTHAWLAPSLDLRLPLFDVGRRFRIVMTRLDRTRIAVVDEDGARVADVRLE
jgi:hypothetical protein